MSKEEEATAPPPVDTDGNNTTPSSSLWNLLSPTNYVPTNLSSMLQQSNIDLSSLTGGGTNSVDKSKELYGGNGSNSLDDNDSIQYEGDSAASLQKQSSIDRNRSVNTTNINSNNLDIITESNYDDLISPTSIQSYTTVESGTTGSGSLSYTDTDTRTYDDGLSHDELTNDELSHDDLTNDDLTDLEDIDMEESLTSLANIVPLPLTTDNLAASQHSNQTELTKEYQHRSKSKLFLLVTVLTVLVCGGVALSLGVSLSDLGFGSDESGSEGNIAEDVVIDSYLPVEPTTTIEEDEVVEEVDCDEFGLPIVEEEILEEQTASKVSSVEPEAVEEQDVVPIEPDEPTAEPEEAQLPDNITCEQINQVMSHQMVTLDTITAYHKDGTLPEGITEEIMGPVLEVQAPGVTMESLRLVSPEMVVKCQQGGVRRRQLRVRGGGLKSTVSRRNLLRGGRPAHHNKINRRRRTFKCKPKQATQEEKDTASDYASNLLAALEEESNNKEDDTLVLEAGGDTTEEENNKKDDTLVLAGGDSTVTTESQEEEEVAIVEEEKEEQVEELNIGGFTGDSSTSEGGGIGGSTGTSEGSGGIGGFTGTSESTAAPSPQPITPEPTPLPSPPPSLAPITSKPTDEPTLNTPSPSKAPITMEPSEEPTVSYSF